MNEMEAATSADGRELRAALRRDGYLLLRQLLPPDAVEEVGADVAGVLADAGWLSDLDTLAPAIPPVRQGDPGYLDIYRRVWALESLHRLANEPALYGVARRITADKVFLHPAKVARLAFPDQSARHHTEPHQDFALLSATPDVLTTWIPLVDCPVGRGGLSVLAGSHRRGFVRPEPGNSIFLPSVVDEDGWVTTDYRVGDVVLFHGWTIHAGLPNRSSSLRLSLDCRYQSVEEPVRPFVLQPHLGGRWEDVTRGWSTTRWLEVPPDLTLERMPGNTLEESFALVGERSSRLVDADRLAVSNV